MVGIKLEQDDSIARAKETKMRKLKVGKDLKRTEVIVSVEGNH